MGSQSSIESGKSLLFLKWEDAPFSFGSPFSFSLAGQLLHSFYTHAYVHDSRELLSRTHLPLSFSTAKYIANAFSHRKVSHSCWKKASLLLCHPSHVRRHRVGFSWLRKAVLHHEEATCLRSVISHIVRTSLQFSVQHSLSDCCGWEYKRGEFKVFPCCMVKRGSIPPACLHPRQGTAEGHKEAFQSSCVQCTQVRKTWPKREKTDYSKEKTTTQQKLAQLPELCY